MDYLRSGYRTSMRLVQGGPYEQVVWYRCPPTAEFYPTRHHFASRNWDTNNRDIETEQVGESTAEPTYYNSRDPGGGALGISVCGTPQVFAEGGTAGGVFFDVDPVTGISDCCFQAEQLATGGVLLGGASDFLSVEFRVDGGVLINASADFFSAEFPTEGGVSVDGTSTFNLVDAVSVGGVELDAAAIQVEGAVQIATGDCKLGGIATFNFLDLVAEGGVQLDGESVWFVAEDAGVLLNGLAVQVQGPVLPAEGGVQCNAEADFNEPPPGEPSCSIEVSPTNITPFGLATMESFVDFPSLPPLTDVAVTASENWSVVGSPIPNKEELTMGLQDDTGVPRTEDVTITFNHPGGGDDCAKMVTMTVE